jgi:hypothetical protein
LVTAETVAWEEVIKWLNDWPDDFLGKIRHAGEILDWALAGIPSFLADRARKLWDEACRYADEIRVWFRDEFFPRIWAPVILWNASSHWAEDVLSKVSTVVGNLDPAGMSADNTWHGPAAQAYGQVITAQKAAANAVTETVNGIHDEIRDLSMGMGAIYISFAALLIESLIEIEGETATFASVIGIPAALAGYIVTLLKIIAGIGGTVAAIKFLAEGTIMVVSNLRKALNDNRGLENGAWPTPVAGLADASMTDGNRSGWTYY